MKIQQESLKAKFENQTMQKLCSNRKKQNFQALKEWDQRRAQRLIIHRRVSDEIDYALQNRLTESDDFLKVVLQFLQDSEEQKKKYENQHVGNPQHRLKANSVSKNIHRNTSRALMKLYGNTQSFKNVRRLRLILENGRKNIENVLLQCKKDIMDIRTKIQLTALQIQNSNEKTIQKCQKIGATYNKDKTHRPLQSDSDFFSLQHHFILQAEQQTDIQRRFGEETIEYLECAEQYEQKKLKIIKETLETYLEELREQNQINQSFKYLLDILRKKTEEEYIRILYSSEELVRPDVLQQLKRIQSKHDNEKIDIKFVKNFLKKLSFVPFDCRNLILKEYRAFRKIGEDLESSFLIFTVDAFLNIYYHDEDFNLSTAQMSLSFQLNEDLEMIAEGDINLRIVLRKWQLLSLGKQNIEELTLVFTNEDQRDEFLEFVARLTK